MFESLTMVWVVLTFITAMILSATIVALFALRKQKILREQIAFLQNTSKQFEEQKISLHQAEQRNLHLSNEEARLKEKLSILENRSHDMERELRLKEQNFRNLQEEHYKMMGQKDNENIALTEKNLSYAQVLEQKNQSISKSDKEIFDLKQIIDTLKEKTYLYRQELGQKIISLEEQNHVLREQIEKRNDDIEKMRQDFAIQFENLAHRIFEEKQKHFKEQSTLSITGMLEPIRQSFGEFKLKIEDSFSKHRDEQLTLKEQIRNIVLTNDKMSKQTENLTKALKGDNKLQGNWGEMILERILEESGLTKGRDYTLQGEGLNLVNEENNKKQRPDVIVHLPEDKHIIIDSKVSLLDYERYISSETDEEKRLASKSFLESIRRHIKDLSSKEYHYNESKNTPDFVLMFMPIEGAYNFALQEDSELHNFAWSQKIVLVSTSTLFATLRTVSSIWRLEQQNQNAQAIAEQAGKIYDKVALFVDDMEKVGQHIKKTEETYQNAMGKLKDGRGNLISQTEKLRELGVKTKKNISKNVAQELIALEHDLEEV